MGYVKKVITVCRTRRTCAHCGELNGGITKHKKSFRILHAKYQKLHAKFVNRYVPTNGLVENDETADHIGLYDNIVDYEREHNSKHTDDLQKHVDRNTTEDLMPWDVRALFEEIEPADYVLIGLRFAKHRPQDLILTKLPVPPAIVRPGARMDDGRANDDDLTVQLSEIVHSNNLIREAMAKGGNVTPIMETFFLMNKVKSGVSGHVLFLH